MIRQIELIEQIVSIEVLKGKTRADHLLSLMEEVGELATAVAVESGVKKNKKLDEPSHSESVDVLICALALYFASNGSIEDLGVLIERKLDKWIKNEKLVLMRFSELAVGDKFRFAECYLDWRGIKESETTYLNSSLNNIYGAHPGESVILIERVNP